MNAEESHKTELCVVVHKTSSHSHVQSCASKKGLSEETKISGIIVQLVRAAEDFFSDFVYSLRSSVRITTIIICQCPTEYALFYRNLARA